MEYTTSHLYFLGIYHATENTVVKTINVTYARRMMGRLGVIPSNIQRVPVF